MVVVVPGKGTREGERRSCRNFLDILTLVKLGTDYSLPSQRRTSGRGALRPFFTLCKLIEASSAEPQKGEGKGKQKKTVNFHRICPCETSKREIPQHYFPFLTMSLMPILLLSPSSYNSFFSRVLFLLLLYKGKGEGTVRQFAQQFKKPPDSSHFLPPSFFLPPHSPRLHSFLPPPRFLPVSEKHLRNFDSAAF